MMSPPTFTFSPRSLFIFTFDLSSLMSLSQSPMFVDLFGVIYLFFFVV